MKVKKNGKKGKGKEAEKGVVEKEAGAEGTGVAVAGGDDIMAVLTEHGATVGLKPARGEAPDQFQSRILDAINALDDDSFGALPKDTRLWDQEIEAGLAEVAKAAAAEALKSGKAATKKTSPDAKVVEAKKTAKATVEAKAGKPGTGFREGTNGAKIVDIIKASGKKGLTMDEIVAAATKAKLESNNIEGRVTSVVKEGARPSGRYGGLFVLTGTKYTAIV